MRTTVTLDPDVELLIKRAMRERGISFKEAVNDAIRSSRASRASAAAEPFPTYDLGQATVDLTKALRVAGELEDEERARALVQGR